MRFLTYFIIAFFISAGVSAQTQLTRSNFPQQGDTLTRYYLDTMPVNEQGAGSGITWDFTGGLTINDTFQQFYC